MAYNQVKVAPQATNEICQDDEKQIRKLRWFLIIILTIWTFAALIIPPVVFYLTKTLLSFSLYSTLLPPIYLWYRIVKYLFPMDDKWFQLEKLKIEHVLGKSKKNAG